MNLFDLPVSTELSDIERMIVRAFVDEAGHQPAEKIYARLARRLHLRAPEIRAIHRSLCKRLMTADRSQPILSAEALAECGHGAAILEIITSKRETGT